MRVARHNDPDAPIVILDGADADVVLGMTVQDARELHQSLTSELSLLPQEKDIQKTLDSILLILEGFDERLIKIERALPAPPRERDENGWVTPYEYE
jgi:hypothetical protein